MELNWELKACASIFTPTCTPTFTPAFSPYSFGVAVELPAGSVDEVLQAVVRRLVDVLDVEREDDVVSAFLERPLRDVHESQLVGLRQLLVALADVGGYGDRRPAELRREAVTLVVGEGFRHSVNLLDELVSFLPAFKVAERAGRSLGVKVGVKVGVIGLYAHHMTRLPQAVSESFQVL